MTAGDHLEHVEVPSTQVLYDWLTTHHDQQAGVWIVTWKRHIPDRHVTHEQVLDLLTAFGWTDGIARRIDEDCTRQLVSPRRTQPWAKSYKDRADRLTGEGRMHPAGLAAVERAKTTGMWDATNDVDALHLPDDLSTLWRRTRPPPNTSSGSHRRPDAASCAGSPPPGHPPPARDGSNGPSRTLRSTNGSRVMADPAAQFTGFTVDAGAFLDELARNNTREWFTAHRADYDQLLRGPMTALLAEAQRHYGPGRVMRPNRDVRFSPDKSPYRTDISLWAGELGGVYAHLDAAGLDVGGGLYGPTRDQLDRARSTIAEQPDQADRLRQAIAELEQQGFQAPEPTLTTAPRGYRRDHSALDLLRLTHYAERCRLPLDADPQLVYESWESTEPLIHWINDHLGAST